MVQARIRLKVACPGCRQKLDLTDLEPFSRVSCPSCQMEIIVPKPFGNLMLEEVLGGESLVAVYRALDLTLDREVAVKVLERDPGSLGDDFLWVARRAAAINHPGVVPIYSCGLQDGMPYLVSQFMSSGNVGQRFRDLPPSESDIRPLMDWCRMVAAGLHAAHSHEEVHGAVTPAAILLDGDGNAKIGDFGLFSLVTRGRPDDPAFVDALPYLAPECLQGEEPAVASDIFGLGVVTYRLLTGRLPVKAAGTAGEMAVRWEQGGGPLAPRDVCDVVPQDVSELCSAMIAVDRGERPADLASVAEVFASACKTRANPKADTQRRPHAVRIRAPVARRLEQVRQEAASSGRHSGARTLNVLLIACLIVLLTLAMVAGLRRAGLFGGLEYGAGSERRQGGRSVRSPARAAADPAAMSADYRRGLEASRLAALAPRRPRPADLDFLRTRDQLKRYLDSLPADLAPHERERIKYVSTTRDYLIRLMRYMPFNNGDPAVVLLRGGRQVEGAIPYCNEQELALRTGEGGPMRTFAWGDLAFDQYVSFLEFYISRRTEQAEGEDAASSATQGAEIAEDCLRAALLCDWYERPELSREFARRALAHSPSVESRLLRLLPSVEP